MTVAELIEQLMLMPQNLPVSVNDEGGGTFHEDVDAVFHMPEDQEHGDRACVVIAVNPL